MPYRHSAPTLISASVSALAASLVLLQGEPLHAVPANVEDGRKVANTTNSLTLRDTISETTLWVLPPTEGKIGEAKLQLAVTNDQCESLVDISSDMRDIFRDLRKLRKQLISALEALQAVEGQTAEKIASVEQRYKTLQNAVRESEAQLDEYYKKYGTRFGGNAHIVYDTNWAANIRAVRASNPSFILVQGVQTKDLRLHFAVPGSVQDGLELSAMPVVIGYSVQGVLSKDLQRSNLVMSSELSVDLSLTMLGACYMKYPKMFGGHLKPTFALSAIYLYPQSFSYKVKATYNLWQIYKHIQESGSSGGLFSSSTWTKTLDENWGDSAFRIAWSEEDPENKLSADKKLEIERTIKADLLANLADLAALKVGSQLVAPASPGQHGAVVIADGLMQNCGANAYCSAAAIAFRALDAIFGSSSSSAEYVKKLNVTATYALDSMSARYVVHGTNFTGSP